MPIFHKLFGLLWPFSSVALQRSQDQAFWDGAFGHEIDFVEQEKDVLNLKGFQNRNICSKVIVILFGYILSIGAVILELSAPADWTAFFFSYSFFPLIGFDLLFPFLVFFLYKFNFYWGFYLYTKRVQKVSWCGMCLDPLPYNILISRGTIRWVMTVFRLMYIWFLCFPRGSLLQPLVFLVCTTKREWFATNCKMPQNSAHLSSKYSPSMLVVLASFRDTGADYSY